MHTLQFPDVNKSIFSYNAVNRKEKNVNVVNLSLTDFIKCDPRKREKVSKGVALQVQH